MVAWPNSHDLVQKAKYVSFIWVRNEEWESNRHNVFVNIFSRFTDIFCSICHKKTEIMQN